MNWLLIVANLGSIAASVAFFVIVTADLVDQRLNPINNYVSEIAIGVWRPASVLVFSGVSVSCWLTALQLAWLHAQTWTYGYLCVTLIGYAGACFFMLNFFVTDREGAKRATSHGRAHSLCTGFGVVLALFTMISASLWARTAAPGFNYWSWAYVVVASGSLLWFIWLTRRLTSDREKSEILPLLHRVNTYRHNPHAKFLENLKQSSDKFQWIGLAERGMIFTFIFWLYSANQALLTSYWAPNPHGPDTWHAFLVLAIGSHGSFWVIGGLIAAAVGVFVKELRAANGTFGKVVRLQFGGTVDKWSKESVGDAVDANTWHLLVVAFYVGALSQLCVHATPVLIKSWPSGSPWLLAAAWMYPVVAGIANVLQDAGTLLLLRSAEHRKGGTPGAVRWLTVAASVTAYGLFYASIVIAVAGLVLG